MGGGITKRPPAKPRYSPETKDRPPADTRRARLYETCTSVVTTQYPPTIIKVMNEAARALTSMR